MDDQDDAKHAHPSVARHQTQRQDTFYHGANTVISSLDRHSSSLPLYGAESKPGDWLLFGGAAYGIYHYVLPRGGYAFNEPAWLAVSGVGALIAHGLFRETAYTVAGSFLF